MSQEITTTEQARLVEIEDSIESAHQTATQSFQVIGKALTEIRDSKLYLAHHATFDDYVTKRWSFGVRRAYQLMEANEVAENVNIVHIPTEAAAREMVKIPKRYRVKAARLLKRAKKPITAASVKHAGAQVSARGGLAASLAAERAPKEPVSIVTVEARTEALHILDEWWAANRQQLVSPPAVTPDELFRRVRRLFEA